VMFDLSDEAQEHLSFIHLQKYSKKSLEQYSPVF
jgi:hypothetical protein